MTVAEHELLQMQVQLDEVRKENVIIKRSNIQLAGKLEDAETRLVEIQLNLESSHANDSSVAQGGETEMLKLKIETMEVELEELKNINEFNDEILQHKEDDIDKLAQKCEDLSQLNSRLMTRLEIMNRELNELKIATEGFDTKSEAVSASTGSGDSTGFTSVRGPASATLGNNDAAPRGAVPRVAWGRGRSTEKDDRLRRASQLFSHPQLTQEFARQKLSTTENKADKSIYGDVLESVSLLQQKLGLQQALNVSDFPELKQADQRKSLDLFTVTCKDMESLAY